MDSATWFTFRGSVHARNPAKTKVFISYCGLSPADLATTEPFTVPVDQVPDGTPCRTCLREVALLSVDVEPLEHAVGRGYVPYTGPQSL